MTVRILQGNCRAVLATLADASVHCIVTSPPYYGLRDYGVDGQIGLEQTPDAYVAELVAVFREARRVLRDDGTFWLNIGDSFGPNKRLLMIPARVALALQAGFARCNGCDVEQRADLWPVHNGHRICLDCERAGRVGSKVIQSEPGWYLRSEIIWAKPNPMPESVRDRPTSAHEKVYLFAKQPRYFYDAEAVKEPFSPNSHATGAGGTFGPARAVKRFSDRRDDGITVGRPNAGGRNLRNVWTITPEPYRDAHFATFPPELPELCIKAGCPKGGTVLDPFFGAGTTGLVANRLGRDCIGIELNPTYATMARNRLSQDAGMFAMVAAEQEQE